MTIAGSDSGGGAGIQADLNTFRDFGVHGTSAVTCLTAQNPVGVRSIQATRPEMVNNQIVAILDGFPVRAVKTGMLYSRPIIRAVVRALRDSHLPLIVDPVMIATSGASLFRRSAIEALRGELLPLARLATPNMDEAGLLLGRALESIEDLRAAARDLQSQCQCAVLVKGGHLKGVDEAVDVLFDGGRERLFTAPLIRNVATHGTGCTHSAAITALMARGHTLFAAVERAKEHVTRAISMSRRAGRHTVLWGAPSHPV